MVYYYKSTVVDPPATIYIGKDKFENEELIKFGWEEDFHADNLSSAHVYLRLEEGQKWKDIPAELIEDCAQLTKANSIEGSKRSNVTIIYTPWANLKKEGSMAVGQVSFWKPKEVRLYSSFIIFLQSCMIASFFVVLASASILSLSILENRKSDIAYLLSLCANEQTARTTISTKQNVILNRLKKTMTEIPPPESTQHLREAREAHLSEKRTATNKVVREKRKEEERALKEKRELKERGEREWDGLYGDDRVKEEGKGNWEGFDEDDFM
ncbi:hypothetical protein MMC25_001988 [Agyrium rufum]|nr:hypothetical protein [Agyrium rufum]